MKKYRIFSKKALSAFIVAMNIIILSGCNSAQAASASVADSSAGSAQKESSSEAASSSSVSDSSESSEPGGRKPSITGTAAYELTKDSASKENEEITATDVNQSGIKVSSSGELNLKNIKIATQGNTSSEDESTLFGLNSAILADSSSNVTLNNCEISALGNGASSVFVTGRNTNINLSNVKISTKGNLSSGLNAINNGTVSASNCIITTDGTNSPAVYGGVNNGTVNVTGGSMTTTGVDSPAVYSAGNVNVTGAVLKSAGAEAAVIEGKSSMTLTGDDITTSGANGIKIYQKNANGSTMGKSAFNMVGGALKSEQGSLFYVTNTDAEINLNSVKITNGSDTLLSSVADSFGTKGNNGGNVTFKADTETLSGNIICDMFSTVNFNLSNHTTYTGTINGNCAGKAVNVSLDATSTWDVTADSYVTAFEDSLTLLTNVKDNGFTIFYDSNSPANKWLDKKTIVLSGGGKLTPDLSKGNIT